MVLVLLELSDGDSKSLLPSIPASFSQVQQHTPFDSLLCIRIAVGWSLVLPVDETGYPYDDTTRRSIGIEWQDGLFVGFYTVFVMDIAYSDGVFQVFIWVALPTDIVGIVVITFSFGVSISFSSLHYGGHCGCNCGLWLFARHH